MDALISLASLLTFQAGYNSAVVVAGTAVLGIGCGIIGFYMMLRKRSMVSDAASHATLPGVVGGFLLAWGLGFDDVRNLPLLLCMAALSAFAGMGVIQWIKRHTRLPEDAAIGTVLSVFFAFGLVLLSYVQTIPSGSKSGLDSFLLGQTAALQLRELYFITSASVLVVVLTWLFSKEFTVLSFDEEFSRAQGYPVSLLDFLMSGLMVAMVCLGLKTVGVILVIALLITPPAAARFWADRLSFLLPLSAFFGGLSGYLGAAFSALAPGLPAGALIVMVASALLALSLFFAPARGLLFSQRRGKAVRA